MARPRGRPRDRSSDETRAAIIAAAQQQFGESSFASVTMGQVAAAAGLTVRALYHYFPGKRELYQAATTAALARFGTEIATRVFVHEAAGDRLRGFVDVYHTLHAEDPTSLSFIGMVLVDSLSEHRGFETDPASPSVLEVASVPITALTGALVDAAIARGEVHEGVGRDAAMDLLNLFGLGLGLAALKPDTERFGRMLDALELLVAGTLLR